MHTLFQRLLFLLRRRRAARDLDDELAFHVAMSRDARLADGASPDDARAAAQRRIGGSVLRVREQATDVWGWQPIDAVLQDVRFAWRMLRKQPAFTLVAAGTLALGIGANTALFSAATVTIFRQPPVSQPDRAVWLFATSRQGAFNVWSYQTFLDVRDRTTAVFSSIAAYGAANATLTVDGVSEGALADIVTAGYFEAVGVRPALGRTFLPDEDRTPTSVVVLADRAWRERFGSDPRIVGRSIAVNGHAFTIVGVAPPSFIGLNTERSPDVWVPMSMQPVMRPPSADVRRALGTNSLLGPNAPAWLNGIARLRPGTTVGQAHATVVAVGHQLARAHPERNGGRGLHLTRISDGLPNRNPAVTRVAMLLFAITGFVLLIACANIASLALARSTERAREVAVRLALGVSRGRLLRQLLTEHLVLALIGGALGVALAAWLITLLPAIAPPSPRPVLADISIDRRVLAFAIVLSIATGLAFGLLPALAASRQDLVTTIREGSSQAGTSRARVRRTLVAAQVALSLLLLIAAGLFIRSFQGAIAIDPGFDRHARVLLGSMELRTRGYSDEQAAAFTRALLDRLDSQPGVERASLSLTQPLGFISRIQAVESEEAQAVTPAQQPPMTDVNNVTTAYFDTLGIKLLKGRAFTAQDRHGAPGVAIVNDVLAAQLWPSANPIGKRLRMGRDGDEPLLEVVGVVAQGRYRSLLESPRTHVYLPWFQHVDTLLTVQVRTAGDPATFAPALRREVAALDPYIPVRVQTLDEHVRTAMWAPRTGASVMSIFGLIAMLLAAIGLYGLMAHSVAQRTREIGVRIALGATHERLLTLILRDACALMAAGLVAGVVAALILSTFVAKLLHGVSPRDPIAFVSMAVLLLIVGVVASLIPARRAMRIDPIRALRLE